MTEKKKNLTDDVLSNISGGLSENEEMSLSVKQDIYRLLEQENAGTTNIEKLNEKITLIGAYLNDSQDLSESDNLAIRKLVGELEDLRKFI